MKPIKYCVYKESSYYVAQCFNVDVASFGQTQEEAVANLKEAVTLHLEDKPADHYQPVDEVIVGETFVHA